MLITLQGNIGPSITTPVWNTFNDFIFCNVGGKSTMSLAYKNIPPMEHNDIPTEIQIRDNATTSAYSKILSYNKSAWLSGVNTDEHPPFRMQIIYDGYDFLYYPEFKLYERPYLLLEYDTSLGTSILVFSKTGANDTKNLAYLKIGESIWLKDYNTFYTITTVQDAVDTITIYVDRDLEEEYFQNDIIVFNEKKYELQSNSNILNDSTTNTLSPFKFKFINEFDSKTWFMANNIGKSNNFTLVNNDFTNILDLQGDDKYISISHGVDVSPSGTIALNTNLNATDTILELSAPPTIPIDIYSYVTIKSDNGLEIVKVTAKSSGVSYTIERGQFNTLAVAHVSTSAVIYLPLYLYFVLLPYNKQLDKRYVVYRNIDFVITWV